MGVTEAVQEISLDNKVCIILLNIFNLLALLGAFLTNWFWMILCLFVVADIQDSMNMNVKVGACGNDGGDDEDDDDEGEAADMEGTFP